MSIWQKKNNKWSNLNTGWIKDKNNWYYLNKDGVMLTGWQSINGKWYFLRPDGAMQVGWLKYQDKWYYLNPSGDMANGWVKVNNKWYYLNPKGGAMVTGQATIYGKSYKFDYTGALIEHNTSLVSSALIDFVKSYEGFFANHYDDGTGVDTIGYGSTTGWIMKLSTCTKEQATQSLMEEINAMAIKIKNDLNSKKVSLKQCEFDALCSFAYNCGTSALFSSTLYKNVCKGIRDSSLKENFTAWCHGGGKIMQGLLNRRIEEYQMFIYSDYKRNL